MHWQGLLRVGWIQLNHLRLEPLPLLRLLPWKLRPTLRQLKKKKPKQNKLDGASTSKWPSGRDGLKVCPFICPSIHPFSITTSATLEGVEIARVYPSCISGRTANPVWKYWKFQTLVFYRLASRGRCKWFHKRLRMTEHKIHSFAK